MRTEYLEKLKQKRTQKDIQETGQEDEGGQIAEERKTRVRQNIRETVQWD